VIDEALQDEIRVAYQTLTEALQLNPRWGQRQMIAEVANALGDPEADPPIAVVEAGTGTGKTVAYLVAALPIARKRGKKGGGCFGHDCASGTAVIPRFTRCDAQQWS
jgi:ATP-dependent DNA helicase DinG